MLKFALACVLCAASLIASPGVDRAGAQPLLREPALGFHLAQGDSEHFAAAKDAGGRFAVVVFSWRDIQPTPEHLYWEIPDAALRAAEHHELEVVARLDRPPEWARSQADSETSSPPWDLDAYTNFARLVAQRYGSQLAGLIVWNEPNLALEWDGKTPYASAYAAMLKAVYPAVKAVAPDLPVLAAGLAFTLGDGVNAVNDLEYLTALYAAGAGPYFDVLAAHPYGFGQPPEQPPDPLRLNFRRVELHRAVMVQNGDADKPVWITEMGWRTSAPAADRWQVVTPQKQLDYTIAAIARGRDYPWLQRMAFWELTSTPDLYGYALWRGPEEVTPAYRALRDRHPQASRPKLSIPTLQNDPIEIVAPDVIIRLGDRGELHPHWIHLHRGGERFSPDWHGEFFLSPGQAEQDFELLLETMQVDQPTNRIVINGHAAGALRPRTRLDPTSTWATQRMSVTSSMLRPGMNEIIIRSGQRLPVRQYSWWRWENFQFRNVRLAPRYTLPEPIIRWAPTAEGEGLGGWAEVNRLRLDEQNQHLWLMGNREGQLLRAATDATPDRIELQGQAQGLSEQVLVDVAELGADQLLAGAQGLLWRREGGSWARVTGAPEAYAYVVLQHAGVWYAGFEAHGVWYATQPQGPWQTAGLQGRTILDLAAGGSVLYAATDDGVYLRSETQWVRLPALPAGDNPQAAEFIPRLWAGPGGELIVRSEDRLFRRNMADAAENPWTPFGPPELQGNLFTAIRCCEPGTLLGTNGQGLWQQHLTGKWRRVDGDYFDNLEILDGAVAGSTLYVATANGLFASDLGSAEQAEPPFEWRKVRGLPPTVTDLLIDPLAAYRWVAATPSGVYRSEDGGRNFEMASGPWNIWDLAWGASGELWAARANGIVMAPAPNEADLEWRTAGGMQTVSFFTVSPQPDDSASVWAGSWGNNIGVSDDSGETLQPLHNGLETLSVLAILRHLSPGQLTVGTIEGLFRSDDGGTSWFKLPGDLTQQTVYALHQSPNGSIFAGAADGLWESADYGASWKPVLGLPPATVLGLGEVMVEGEPLLWAGTEDSGVWLSSDEGRTWRFGGLPGRSVYALVVDFNDESFVAATDQGLRMGTLASAR